MSNRTRIDENLQIYFEALQNQDKIMDEDIQRLLDASRIKLQVDNVYVAESFLGQDGFIVTYNSFSKQEYDVSGNVKWISEAQLEQICSHRENSRLYEHRMMSADGTENGSTLYAVLFRGAECEGCVGIADYRANRREWTQEERCAVEKLARVLRQVVFSARASKVMEAGSERLLHQNEANEAVFASIDCGVIRQTVSGNHILKVNQAALDILGYDSQEELEADLQNGIAGTVPAEDQRKICRCMEKLHQVGDSCTQEYRVCHKDGRVVYVTGNIRLLMEEGQLIYQRILLDHTEQKENAERKQREEQVRHMELINALSNDYGSVYLVDLDTDSAIPYRLNEDILREFGDMLVGTVPLGKTMEQYVKKIVYEPDKEMMRKAGSRETLLHELGDKDTYTLNYRVFRNGYAEYYQMKAVRVGEWDGNHHIVMGFRSIDKEFQRELRQQRQIDETLEIVASLSKDYGFISIVNPQTGEMSVYQADQESREIIHTPAGKNNYQDALRLYTSYIYEEDREAWVPAVRLEEVLRQLEQKEIYTVDFRNDVHGKIEYYQFIYTKACGRDNNIQIVFAKRFMTEIIEKKLKQQNLLHQYEQLLVDAISELYAGLVQIDMVTWETDRVYIKDGSVLRVPVGQWDSYLESHLELVLPADAENVRRDYSPENLMALLPNGKVITNYQGISRAAAEEHRYYSSVTHVQEKGRHRTATIFIIDNTATMRHEQEQRKLLENALAQAEHANKAKSTFLSNMSHDIRTPMNAIIGFTALAITHMDNQERVLDYLKKIASSSNHLLSLINDVLDMSRIESGKIHIEEKPCSLPEVMHDLRNIMQPEISSRQLDFYIDTVDVQNENIFCDRLRLNQVLLNLLSNAFKFTAPGGTVSMRIIEKRGAVKGHADYEFRVKDTGIGISEEFLVHIFEPFERERNSTISGIQGTGLGMAITKNIVDMMGGTIAVSSTLGQGTEFVVNLTFRLQDAAPTSKVIEELESCHALVVDDDFNTCDSVTNMLQQIGMRAEWTMSGREAILRAKQAMERQDAYRVYIVDWLLPDLNGMEVVRRLRRRVGDTAPIIILTAYDWSDIEIEAREAGVTAFCSKPLFLSELRDCLQKVLNVGKVQNASGKVSLGQEFWKGRRILLTEDNELNREIATEILIEAGFLVECAENGKIAVDMVKRSEVGYYCLVLMDIQMPVMDGYTAARQIRALENHELASIPILAMTANAFDEDKQAALDSGMNAHLAKPVNIETLMKVLNEVLEKQL